MPLLTLRSRQSYLIAYRWCIFLVRKEYRWRKGFQSYLIAYPEGVNHPFPVLPESSPGTPCVPRWGKKMHHRYPPISSLTFGFQSYLRFPVLPYCLPRRGTAKVSSRQSYLRFPVASLTLLLYPEGVTTHFQSYLRFPSPKAKAKAKVLQSQKTPHISLGHKGKRGTGAGRSTGKQSGKRGDTKYFR